VKRGRKGWKWGERERERMNEYELGYVIVEVDRSKICRVGCQAGDPGKS